MEWHIQCDPKEISRYVFCPGDQARARKIAAHLDDSYLVTDSRGYVVFSGRYKDVFMTVCGTGMGGPTVAIALEELAHMGPTPSSAWAPAACFRRGSSRAM